MSGGVDETQRQQKSVADTQLQTAQTQAAEAAPANQRAQELYDLTKPGLATAEAYYKRLSSGDPNEIQRAIAPASEKIAASSEAAKKNIEATTPRGGEQRLALEQADIAKSSQIGSLATTAYTGSFPALASLAGEGIGLSLNEVNAALSALSGSSSSLTGAGNTFGNVGAQQEQGKSSTLGLIGSLAGGAGTAAGGIYCWIAEELFGKDDARTHVLRFWFTQVIPDSILSRLYRQFGQRSARLIRKCKFARIVFRWAFQFLLKRAWCDVHDAPVIYWSTQGVVRG